MTCIIGAFDDKEVVFVADSRTVRGGSEIIQHAESKLLKVGNRIYGCAGMTAARQETQRFIVEERGVSARRLARELPELMTRVHGSDEGFCVLCYDAGRLCFIDQSGFLATLSGTFHAIGSGMDIAIGAMEAFEFRIHDRRPSLETRMELAMRFCAKHDSGVDGRLQWERLERT